MISWRRVLSSIGVAWLVLGLSGIGAAQEEFAVLREAAESVSGSVVQIETTGGKERVGEVYLAAGPMTGLVVSDDGLIVTSSYTVVHEPATILIRLSDGRRVPASVLARDHARNLVLLRAEEDLGLAPPRTLPKDQIEVGSWVVAVGKSFDPAEINSSVGIVSAVDRVWGRAIQTDAKISPSNYGGPLVDLNGNVVAIIAPLSPQSEEALAGFEWYDSGIGFAVPISDVLERLPRMALGEDLYPGKLGVTPRTTNPFTSPVVIASVGRLSPAGSAGLQSGDELVEVDGRTIRRYGDLRHALGSRYAGERVTGTVIRDGQNYAFEAVLEKDIEAFQVSTLGILPSRAEGEGVGIEWVLSQSPAERAGLVVGDRITKIGETLISSLDELASSLASFEPGAEIELQLLRDGAAIQVALRLDSLSAEFVRLPESRSVSGEATDESQLGELRLEQFPFGCDVVSPKELMADGNVGLIVWLSEPGKQDAVALQNRWGVIAARRNVVVIAPHASQERTWVKEDVERIGLLVQRAIQEFGVDPRKVTISGTNAGAQMATLVFVDSTRPVRGLAIVGAGIAGNVPLPENEPLRRLLIASWLKTDVVDTEPVQTLKRALEERGLPFAAIPSPELNSPETWDEMAQWTMSLHRH